MTSDGAPRATLVVVPRERFSLALASLDDLLAHSGALGRDFELVYVDAGSPRRVRREVARRAAEHGFDVARSDRLLSPNQARNLGAGRVHTRYAVFVDNDVRVRPGWLAPLVAAADETDAWLCGPLILLGRPGHEVVHSAGGELEIRDDGERRRLFDDHRLVGVPAARLPDLTAAAPLGRERTGMLEFHCMLVRMDAYRELGGLDEALLSLYEYEDLCLSVAAAGGSIVVEPASVVTYEPPESLRWMDWRYFLVRWSEAWNRASLDHFHRKWRLALDAADAPPFRFAEHHRRIFWRRPRRALRPLLGSRGHGVQRGLRSLERLAGARAGPPLDPP